MKTYAKTPAKTKAHEDYLLTTKLFCGTCGSMMVGECGTSKSKTSKYYYYKCTEAKRKRCSRSKGIKKDWIEKLAVLITVETVLKDDVIDKIADAVIALQEKEDTTIPAMLKQLRDCEKSIENLVGAIAAGIYSASTKEKLDQLEAEKERLNLALLETQLQRPKFTKENVIQWINQFKKGDIDNKEYQRRVIDTFINTIYVYDDRIVFTYNYSNGSSIVTFQDISNNYCSDLESSTPPVTKESAHALSFVT